LQIILMFELVFTFGNLRKMVKLAEIRRSAGSSSGCCISCGGEVAAAVAVSVVVVRYQQRLLYQLWW
jgi:hypothetical protein